MPDRIEITQHFQQQGAPETKRAVDELTAAIRSARAEFEQLFKSTAAESARFARTARQISGVQAGAEGGLAGLLGDAAAGLRVAAGRSILGGFLRHVAAPLGTAYGLYRLARWGMESIEGAAQPAAQFEIQAGNLQRRMSTRYPFANVIRGMSPEEMGRFPRPQFLQMMTQLQELSGINDPRALRQQASLVAYFARTNALQPEQINQLMGTAIRAMPLGTPQPGAEDYWGRLRATMEISTKMGVDRAETMRGMMRATQLMSQAMGVFNPEDRDALRRLIDVLNLSGNRALQGERGLGAMQGIAQGLGQPGNMMAVWLGMQTFYPGGQLREELVPPDLRKQLRGMHPYFGTQAILETVRGNPRAALAMLGNLPPGDAMREVLAQQAGIPRTAMLRIEKVVSDLDNTMKAKGIELPGGRRLNIGDLASPEAFKAALARAVEEEKITPEESKQYQEASLKGFKDYSDAQKTERMLFEQMNRSLERSEMMLHLIAERLIPFNQLQAAFFKAMGQQGTPSERRARFLRAAESPIPAEAAYGKAALARMDWEERREELARQAADETVSPKEREEAREKLKEHLGVPPPPLPEGPTAAKIRGEEALSTAHWRALNWGLIGGMVGELVGRRFRLPPGVGRKWGAGIGASAAVAPDLGDIFEAYTPKAQGLKDILGFQLFGRMPQMFQSAQAPKTLPKPSDATDRLIEETRGAIVAPSMDILTGVTELGRSLLRRIPKDLTSIVPRALSSAPYQILTPAPTTRQPAVIEGPSPWRRWSASLDPITRSTLATAEWLTRGPKALPMAPDAVDRRIEENRGAVVTPSMDILTGMTELGSNLLRRVPKDWTETLPRIFQLPEGLKTLPKSILDRLSVLSLKSGVAEAAEIPKAAAGDPAMTKALTALRLAEGGGKGREFGVLSESAPTYQKQLEIAAKSIRNSEERFRAKFGRSPRDMHGEFTDEFLKAFSERWAPPGAHPLNRQHFENLRGLYRQMGGPGESPNMNFNFTFNIEGQGPPPGFNQAALAQHMRETVERFMADLYKSQEAAYYQTYNYGA